MNKRLSNKIIATFFSFFLLIAANAQEATTNADFMRSNGKIYVVVAVVVTILVGLLSYLISLDRKLSRLEKESNKN
jgi:hypothetical protein